MRRSLPILAALAWAALATLPTELMALWRGWDALSPESVIAECLWMPVAIYCQLQLLLLAGRRWGIASQVSPAAALPSALGVEILLALRLCRVLLLSVLPALIVFSILGVATPGARVACLLLALAGAVPPLVWFFRRLFAPALVLWQGLSAAAAIRESVALSRGKLKGVIIPLLLWNGLAQGLELGGMAWEPFNWLALPLSLIISTAALAWAYAKLTL